MPPLAHLNVVLYSSYANCSCLILSFFLISFSVISAANMVASDKATSVTAGLRGAVCVHKAVDSSSSINEAEFTRSASELGLWCVWSSLSIKQCSEPQQCPRSVVGVNCVPGGVVGGAGPGAERTKMDSLKISLYREMSAQPVSHCCHLTAVTYFIV